MSLPIPSAVAGDNRGEALAWKAKCAQPGFSPQPASLFKPGALEDKLLSCSSLAQCCLLLRAFAKDTFWWAEARAPFPVHTCPSLVATAPLSLKHGFSVFLSAWEGPKE